MDFEDSAAHVTTVVLMGRPVGLVVEKGYMVNVKNFDKAVKVMGFDDIDDYINYYPGKFKIGTELVNKLYKYNYSEYNYETIQITKDFQIDFFKRNYFWCYVGSTKNYTGQPTAFMYDYEEDVLSDEPRGCMFLLQPTMAEMDQAQHMHEATTNNRWFCSDWKEGSTP